MFIHMFILKCMKSANTVTKISKWGNGYGIRVPIAALESFNLAEGSEVVLILQADGVKILPRMTSLVDMTLAEIMAGVTPETLSADNTDDLFGAPQGNEVW